MRRWVEVLYDSAEAEAKVKIENERRRCAAYITRGFAADYFHSEVPQWTGVEVEIAVGWGSAARGEAAGHGARSAGEKGNFRNREGELPLRKWRFAIDQNKSADK
jgi:hypothetical protein